jgi:hypothetical protein
MYMYLPFAIALLSALLIWYEKKRLGIALAVISAVVTVAWFLHHAADKLNISL